MIAVWASFVTKSKSNIHYEQKKDALFQVQLSQAKVQTALATDTTTTAAKPRECEFPNTEAAPFLPDFPVPEGLDGEPGLLLGADGVKVAEGLETQELAAAFAAETDDGAAVLTVPLPLKLQD
jgi:hypothetical protein